MNHCDFTPCRLTPRRLPLETTQVHTLYEKLKHIGGKDLEIWLDTVELKKSGQVDSESLKRNVKQSLAVLVFLSEEYLTAEFCQTELRTAEEAGIPIIIVCDGGVTEVTLKKEIQEFKTAKGECMQAEDKATLRAMEKLKRRVLAQRDIEQKYDAPAGAVGDAGNDGPVLWWSREFVRVALKGVVQQLLMCHRLQKVSTRSSGGVSDGPRLLFHDELLLRRKSQGKQVSLFVSPDYPPERQHELKRAFQEAEANLGITVSISSTRGAADHSVLLLYPASGLKWLLLGHTPKDGKELVNAAFSEALKDGRSRTFTEDEWKAFGMHYLHGNSFIKSGDSYFGPADRGFFGTSQLVTLTNQTLGLAQHTPAPFLLYSTDMSADMSEHRLEGANMLGEAQATRVFTPMWSAWSEVSSLQTVAAEEKLRATHQTSADKSGTSGTIKHLRERVLVAPAGDLDGVS